MLRIGLTGGIGCGKTTVAHIFEVLGIPVYYADTAAKRLMNEDSQLKKNISSHFGAEVYPDGTLDRKALANIVFSNAEKLLLLNSLVHPATIADGEQWSLRQQAPYVVREAALIFESGVNKLLDYVIGVSAPLELRIQRVQERDKISRSQVFDRMKNQMDEEEKLERCDFLLFNDDHQLLLPQVLLLHEKLLEISSERLA